MTNVSATLCVGVPPSLTPSFAYRAILDRETCLPFGSWFTPDTFTSLNFSAALIMCQVLFEMSSRNTLLNSWAAL